MNETRTVYISHNLYMSHGPGMCHELCSIGELRTQYETMNMTMRKSIEGELCKCAKDYRRVTNCMYESRTVCMSQKSHI